MVAGMPTYSRIVGGKRTGYFYMVIECIATVGTHAVGTLLNEGSIASLFQYVGVDEAGTQVWNNTGMGQMKLSDAVAARTRYNVRLASAAAIGAYPLREVLIFPYAWPLSGGEWETSFVELNPSNITQLFVTPAASFTDGINKLALADSSSTIVISALTVRCYQEYDNKPVGATAPVYRPQVRMITQPISQAVSDFPFELATPLTLRGMLILQETAARGLQSDILTSRRLLCDGDNGMLEGPAQINQQDVTDMQAFEFGGDIRGSTGAGTGQGAAYFYNFQSGGRLTQMLTPNLVGPNFRLEVTGQPSVVSGASSSQLRAVLIEMAMIPGITRDMKAYPLAPGM